MAASRSSYVKLLSKNTSCQQYMISLLEEFYCTEEVACSISYDAVMKWLLHAAS